MTFIDRREFFGLVSAAALSHAVRRAPFAPQRGARVVVTSIASSPDVAADIRRGTEMAVEEAQRAAAMFRASIEHRVVGDATDADTRPGAVQILIEENAGDEARARAVAAATRANAVWMNVTDYDEALRDRCLRRVMHIVPTRAALDATRLRLSGPGKGGEAAIWDDRLTRFGADTLNRRYRERFAAPMTGAAWAAWFAVKCAWEATLQSRATSAAELLAFFDRPATRFDGHKGAPLYFDRRHQLAQPLYLVGTAGVLDETSIPDRSTVRERGIPCDWKE